jgi:hypothetical protein
VTVAPDVQQAAGPRPRLSEREHLVTVACSTWLIVGLFLDGWAHNHQRPESFFTPWHAVLYSGFLATAAWMWSRYERHRGVPAGYGLGLVGVALFAVGGVGDMAWHLVFGVEVNLEALLSPTHLVLFLSGLLILSSPLRAAWSDTDADVAPAVGRFLPALLSTTLVTATVSFFLMEFSPFLTDAATADPYRLVRAGFGSYLAREVEIEGFASILVATLVLLGPTLLLLRRWRVPAGSFAILFATVAVLTSALHGFEMVETVLAAAAGGVAADVLARQLQPSRSPQTVLRVVGFVVPLVMWLTYFAVLAVFYTVGWSVEFWAGITLMSALAGLALAVLMTLEPPPLSAGPTGA